MRINFLLISFLIFLSSSGFALYDFPADFIKVNQTYGDYNGGWYHEGVDLPNPVDKEVRSPIPFGILIEKDNKRASKGYVCIQDTETLKIFAFGHIEPTSNILNTATGTIIPQNTLLGVLQVFPDPISSPNDTLYSHLHISVTINTGKACANGGAEDPLPYFSPVTQTLTPADIFFTVDKATAANEVNLENKFPVTPGPKTVFGDVDVIVHARNNVNGGNRSGVYKIDWAIADYLVGGTIISSATPFVMRDQMSPLGGWIEDAYLSPPTSDPADGTETDWQNYYNITNSGQKDAAIVKMYSNVEENSWKTAARPDSKYSVQVRTYAYPAAGAPAPAESERMVITDNTRPYVKQMEVKQGTTTVYQRSWEPEWDSKLERNFLRSYAPVVEKPVTPGEYTVFTTFSEPMFAASLVGINNAFTPFSTVQVSTLTIGSYYMQDAMLPLEIRGADIAGTANELLKIDPDDSYIDPALELTRDASGYMPASGGTDRFHSLHVEAGFAPSIGYEDRNHILAHGCGGNTCGTETEPVNLAWNRVRFSYADIGSGIREIIIHSVAGGIPDRKFSYAPHVYKQEIELNLEDGLYVQTVTDNSGYPTTMWFRVDPESPLLRISGIDMAVAAGTYTVHGTVQDTNSGMDFFHLDGGSLHKDFAPTPGSRELIPFTSPELNIGSGSYYVFSAQDKAGNGSFPQPIFEFIRTAPGGVAPGQTNAVANYISEVKASGEPCTISITSARNTFAVPVGDGLPDGVSISAALSIATTTPQVVLSTAVYLHGNVSVGVSKICEIIGGENVCRDACDVSLAGYSILGLANGPAEAFVRNSSAATAGVKFGFEGSIITFYNLNAPPGSELAMESVPSPAAPGSYVVYPPGLNRSLRLKYEGATYDGIKIKICGMLPGDAPKMNIVHYKDDGTKETLGLVGTADEEYALDMADADHCVTRLSGSNSLFSLVAPISMYDNAGPVVVFKVDNSFEKDGVIYISSSASVALDAEDRSSNTFALAGAASTYYQLDAEPVPAVYNGPFRLGEGEHSIHYYAVDKIDNLGESKTAQLRVDSTPPESMLLLNGQPIASGATVYATTADFTTLVATDTVSNGVYSGLTTTYFLVDVSPEDCKYAEWAGGGINGIGSCENSFYAAPFSLPVGWHTIYYQSVDNVGNREVGKSAYITVSAEQAALPIVPSSGPIGVPFTIEGSGFGAYSAGTTVVLIGGTTAPLTLWTDVKIQGAVPGTLAGGQQPVSVRRGSTVLAEVSSFTVTQPALYTLAPSSGAIGIPFTVTGESFGNYVANYTRVLLGGATMPLTLWTDTKIQGTIPGTLSVGDYEFVVERSLNGGVVRTSTTAFSLRNMEAYWLAPSSGPIGMPFTITGAGFGNYSAAYTHVLLGNTTAPLTLWTDTKIHGTVPGSLASGQYPVLVERKTSDGGFMQTSPMAFEVVTVDVSSMTPVVGPIGLPFTIYGNNFGNYVAKYTRVLIGGTTAPLTLWTATQIQGTIPGALAVGEYPVVVERELNGGIVRSSALAFVVSTPTAYNMSPSSGPIGVPFTINGVNFGNYSAAYTGVLINGATVPLTLWTDTKIQGTIPGSLVPGQYPVVVGRMTADGGAVQTNALAFEVVGINVASMTPVSGPIGMPFTIYGGNFGNYTAGYTKVLIGGATVPLTLWTDTKIQGTVPGSLAAGQYPAIVERTLNGGQAQSLPLAFSVTAPAAYTLAPSSGPIGLPFTITGESFGNYVAGSTKVLIGGATTPLTLWADTQINGTVPGALAAGVYELYVERALNSGVVRTSTFSFTVGTPYLGTLSPSTASVIAPFTITGYNFGNYVANYTKVLVNGTTTALTLWTDSTIQGKLPFLPAGQYPVQVQRYLNGGLAESATAWINIEKPVISSMTPTSGAAGVVFNLYGTGFGPYDAAIARVTLGGAACSLSLWTDIRITGTVPSALSYGTHTVVASRGQTLSNALEFYIPGGYSPSMMRPGLSPSALEFKLGEVYVYPDPAKGGKVPTFHIEVGTADNVKIRIYTVSGQLAQERTLTGSPQAVGSIYAYEYAWTGRIASGVYYYTIEAERSGKKIKTKGRFSVVR